MDLRPIDTARLDQLWELHRAYKEAIGEEAPTDEDREKLRAAMDEKRILFFGAWDDETLAGCCSVTVGFSTFDYAPAGVFEDFYILPAYRHKGLARQLAETAFKASGVKTMTVGCADCDRNMYMAIGFKTPLGHFLAYAPAEEERHA
ncbi:MAG: GNAT family N-acetyltransferase [Clostridia bacterium]|nr:GNAT family N-acetyltransferase [Clostridia bacterium]